MEKISAACAAEWSIELEKALRSKVPGRAVEAISLAGRRIERWNLEPEPTMTVYNLYGLVPGEERLFANAILLRLADAFVNGDGDVKLAVVRAFMGIRKCERKRRRSKKGSKIRDGILSKGRVSNSFELLRRVKVVFDGGDADLKAMSLALFGCWADFANDSANIRYLILSNMVSTNVSVVKAALFAAGCFCDLSSDFASVVLEMLVSLVTSPDVPSAARWAGVRIFSRMQSSYAVAERAYKTGRKLVSESTDETFLVQMLFPLSELAGTLCVLVSDQVNLLCSFLGGGNSHLLQETSLRCLRYMIRRGACHFNGETCMDPLLRIVDDPGLPSCLQCEAVAVLHQIVLSMPPKWTSMDKLEFDKLLNCILNLSRCPLESKSLLAMRCLADLCIRLGKCLETGCAGISPSLPMDVATLLTDRIIMLFKQMPDDYNVCKSDSKIFLEAQTGLRYLFQLVGKHPNLIYLVLDKFNILIRHCINDFQGHLPPAQEESLRLKGRTIFSEVMIILNKFLVACFDFLSEISAMTPQVLDKVKILIQDICDCKLFSLYIQTMCSTFCSQLIWNGMLQNGEEIKESLPYDYWVESEVFILMCTQRMLMAKDFWLAYKFGMLAASRGSWLPATFVFGSLMTNVRSHSHGCWLKSLAQLSLCEMRIQLLLLPSVDSRSVECLNLIKLLPVSLFEDGTAEVDNYVRAHTSTAEYGEKLFGACSYLIASWETLNSCDTSGRLISFQVWFLALRVKMLGIVTETVVLLARIPFNRDAEGQNGTQISMAECSDIFLKLTQLSARLKQLSEEFDLMAESFIDIDRRSLKVISTLAIGCSLLSFAAGSILFVPNLPREVLTPSHKNISQVALLQNLLGRLNLADHEISASLSSLTGGGGCHETRHRSHFRPKKWVVGFQARELLSLCRALISRVVSLKNQAMSSRDEELNLHVTEICCELLLDITKRFMLIPFRAPKYYFRTRPCMGSEIFAVTAGMKLADGIFVSPGLFLSLDICIQLRNVPLNLLMKPIKLYCIICCNSLQDPVGSNEKSQWCASLSWETDDILTLNEELYEYVAGCAGKTSKEHTRNMRDAKAARAFLSFDQVNEIGQGFSNCLLDVSRFPSGRYRMEWHSCCIDKRGSYWSLIPLNKGPVFTIQ